MANVWKKGRGKLGFMRPLLGRWEASADSPMGPIRCTRTFQEVLGGSYIRLEARWEFSAIASKARQDPDGAGRNPTRAYEEIALIGAGDGGTVSFWSFTSDGKRSQGTVCDVTDLHKSALGFQAQMPAGLARMAYWPDDGDGFFWAVESKTAKGWKRFTEHHYHSA
jgi:hypothetical protein